MSVFRPTVHLLLTLLAGVVAFVSRGLFEVAALIGASAAWAWPEATRNNCWLWAELEYRRLHRQWVRDGMVKGAEPYRLSRPSRLMPRSIDHRLVAVRSQFTGALVERSFVPNEREDLPLIWCWKALWFRGQVRDGDEFLPLDSEAPHADCTP